MATAPYSRGLLSNQSRSTDSELLRLEMDSLMATRAFKVAIFLPSKDRLERSTTVLSMQMPGGRGR